MSNENKTTARTTPHNIEAEQAVLCSILIDNDGTLLIFSELTPDHFYSPTHKNIFTAMQTLYQRNSPIDFVTLVSYLDSTGQLEKVGGISYLTQLNDSVPSSANFRHYADILKGLKTRRSLIRAANEIIERSYATEDAQVALQGAEKAVFDIAKQDERKELTPMANEMPGIIDRLDTIHRDPSSVRGLRSGFYALDNVTNGFQKSDLIIIAARPSVGKTAFGLNIVLNSALKYGAKCAVFSLEMSKQSLATRALCSTARISMSKANKGEWTADGWKSLLAANKALANAKIYVDDNSIITPAEIMRKCMRLKREQGLDLVMIDYLGLMTGGGKRESRQVEVADNSRMIKILAKELDVPVLLLSQLNRSIESRRGEDALPMLSDLRESGAIEQDADIVMFIHRDKAEGAEVEEAQIKIAKHRNGPLATVKLDFHGEWSSFTNQAGAGEGSPLASKKPDTVISPANSEPSPDKKPKKPEDSKGKKLDDLLDVF